MECQLAEETQAYVRIALAGILDTEGVGQIQLRFLSLTTTPGKHAIVDISGVDFISSLGMGMLLNCHNGLKRNGRKMILVKPQPLVEASFKIAGLAPLLRIQHEDHVAPEMLSAEDPLPTTPSRRAARL